MKSRTPRGDCFPASHRALLSKVAGVAMLSLLLLAAACGDNESSSATQTPSTAVAGSTGAAASPTLTSSPTNTPVPTATPTPEPIGLLDGIPMDQDDFTARMEQRPVAVMIDNSPAAYPQAGLDRADVVVEAFVEGYATRYLAVYWRQDAEQIDPVRSVRTPFVHWAAELDVILGTVGSANYPGEANAGHILRTLGIPWLDHDEPIGAPTFLRDPARHAPHNTVTSTHELRDAAGQLGRDPGDGAYAVEPWRFKDDNAGTAAAPGAHRVDVRFRGSLAGGVTIGWVWDESEHRYQRYRAGVAHRDSRTGEQITATNVIVMVLNSRIASPHGHLVYDQLGEGPATIYLDGKRIDATWRKESIDARTRFFSAGGTEIALNRGPTWIAMLNQQSTVADSPQ